MIIGLHLVIAQHQGVADVLAFHDAMDRLDLAGRIEVYRNPAQSDEARYGWSYRTIQSSGQGQHITLLAAPESPVAVADILP